MADDKITALPEKSEPVGTDLLPIVDDPTGAATTKKATLLSMGLPGRGYLTLRPEVNTGEVNKQAVPLQIEVGVFFAFTMPIYDEDHQELYFRECVPMRWDESSDIIFHLKCCLTDAEDEGDNFKFQIDWEHAAIGEPVPATSNPVTIQQAVLAGRTAQYDKYELLFTIDYDIDGPGEEIATHELLGIRLRRIDADNPNISNNITILN